MSAPNDTATLASADEWLRAASYRRTIYGLTGTSSVPDSRVENILRKVQSFAPSAFNSQPIRYTLVTGEKHKQLWDIIISTAQPVLMPHGDKVWSSMRKFCEGHKAAYGSVIFWESGLAQKEAAGMHKSATPLFPQYGDHASGIAQILVWTALELEGLGANLQHMQSIAPVEAAMKTFCGVPEDCSLKAHINYGDKSQPHPDVPAKAAFDEVFNKV